MTLVVTYTEGFLGCFTVEHDGAVRQRALIDTGSPHQSPQQLAEVGLNLAKEYGWQVNGVKPVKPERLAHALENYLPEKKPRGKQQPSSRTRIKRTDPHEMRAWVLAYLAEHPDTTLMDIAAVRGEEWNERTNAYLWNVLDYLVKHGKVVKDFRRLGRYGAKAGSYSLPPLANSWDGA